MTYIAIPEDLAYQVLVKHFGNQVHFWPRMPRSRPSWWQYWLRKDRDAIDGAFMLIRNRRFTDKDCREFWREIRLGQQHDDAGGYMWRCWKRALGFVSNPLR